MGSASGAAPASLVRGSAHIPGAVSPSLHPWDVVPQEGREHRPELSEASRAFVVAGKEPSSPASLCWEGAAWRLALCNRIKVYLCFFPLNSSL